MNHLEMSLESRPRRRNMPKFSVLSERDDRRSGGGAHLREGEVHLWHMDLQKDSADSRVDDLSAEERVRASRFVFERDRIRFQRARIGLRHVLARYLDVVPADIQFVLNDYGKPRLFGGDVLRFNVSHTDDSAVIAVGAFAEIGVDIESRRPQRDLRALARTVFSVSENDLLSALHGDALLDAFYICWTRKEAYVKALGVGLTLDPASITVGVSPDELVVPMLGSHPACRVATLAQDERTTLSLAVTGKWSRTDSFEVFRD
jgi:4'-phosphopantetheinyl transferase